MHWEVTNPAMKPRFGSGGGVVVLRHAERAIDRKALFRHSLHALFCVLGFLLGHCLSQTAFLILATLRNPGGGGLGVGGGSLFPFKVPPFQFQSTIPLIPSIHSVPSVPSIPSTHTKSSRVHVGRHEILIRPWPHPDPNQTFVAHWVIEQVQAEQRQSSPGLVKDRRRVLVVTPTFLRTFQSMHLTGLIHSIRLAPPPLLWIVVEAGGISNETTKFLSESRIPFFHLGFPPKMPSSSKERLRMESRMRIAALRFIHEQQLDGIIVFADDSNTHSLEFFDEVQKVRWIGAISVGLLSQPGSLEATPMDHESKQLEMKGRSGNRVEFPVQGPVCNSTKHLTGWQTSGLPHNKVDEFKAQGGDPLKRLEWAGFAVNAQILFNDSDKPSWIRDWLDWVDNAETPLDMVKDEAYIEPLGHCGKDTLLWWLRVEARADSKFPSSWIIDPPLETVVSSRHTPWPDPPVGRPPTTHNSTTVKERKVQQPRKGSKGKQSSLRHLDRRRRQTVESDQQRSHIVSDVNLP